LEATPFSVNLRPDFSLMKETLTIIKPPRRFVPLNLGELLRYRELFYVLTWRDVKVRYKQTFLGILWAILQPFTLMIIFSVFFGGLAKVPSDNAPYPIFVFSGLLFWNYFAAALTGASNSLADNESILKKIYFPRLFLPLSATITPLVDFLISLVILAGLMIYYQFTPTLAIILLPFLIALTFVVASGIGFFLSAINVVYRDIKYILPFFVQILFFLTPVIYPSTLVSPEHRWLLALNPMTGIIEAARSGVLGNRPIDWQLLGISASVGIAFFIAGLLYFRKAESYFADVS
jgi:lipopolysaccharide transport system permease protein